MFLLGNKFYLIFISIWIIGLYFVLTNFHATSNNTKVIDDRIEYLQYEVDSLRRQVADLKLLNSTNDASAKRSSFQCEELKNELRLVKRQLAEKSGDSTTTPQHGPALEYEQLRRKIETQARELSYFTGDQLSKISEKLSADDKKHWANVIFRFGDQSRVLLASIRNLTVVDGHQSWRDEESRSLSKLVQARLHHLQHPSEPCTNVKRLQCNINKGCGYGCEIHHAMHCFHIAYGLGRPLILLSDGWRYNPGGFDQVFLPLSNNCTKSMASGASPWSMYENAQLVEIPLIDNIHPRKDFMPMAIPEDLCARLIRLHGNPFVWFTGQLIKYLLRPQKWLIELIEKKHESLQFETPIVGIHVRRTDKVGSEASFHDIDEYMKHAEDYFLIYQYQNPNIKLIRRVYLATDEPSVFKDARSKHPNYIFYGDSAIAQSAQLNSRYGTESLKGVLLDIHFLSKCDYLVCTFSSQICRVAYEVMQQRLADGSWRVQPLDDIYYFGGQNAHNQRAFVGHRAVFPNEFNFERNDIIGTEGNHWDGFSKGSDKTNGQSGLYPSYKIEEIVNVASMHTYPDVQMKDADL